MQKIKSEINHVDSGILAAVRQQVMIFSCLFFDVLIYQLSKVFRLHSTLVWALPFLIRIAEALDATHFSVEF